jgi:hypothetical protein
LITNGRIREGHWIELNTGEADLAVSSEITVLDNFNVRQADGGHGSYYPALSVPIGGKEDFSCPAAHVDDLRRRIASCSHILILGFSCLDTHVLRLLAGTPPELKRVVIVNGNNAEGMRARNRLATVFESDALSDDARPVTDKGFGSAMREGDIAAFLEI